MAAKRGPSAGILSRTVQAVLLKLYRMRGWRATGAAPQVNRAVIIAVPHSTNWDFVNYLGLTDDLGVTTHFMAKNSLFRWPMGRFMRDMGGLSIDRGRKAKMVEQMADRFAAAEAADESLLLTIAPEGTRQAVAEWRSGFYRIAMAAGVPVVPGWIDYDNRTGGLGAPIMPSGDYMADMGRIVAFYETVLPTLDLRLK